MITLALSVACATSAKPVSPANAPRYDFADEFVRSEGCRCTYTPLVDDEQVEADRAARSIHGTMALEAKAQPWFSVQAPSADIVLELGDAYRTACESDGLESCQSREVFRGTLTASQLDGQRWGAWPVIVTRTGADGLDVSTQISPPPPWLVREPLPAGSQLHLVIETLHPLSGEIFAVIHGSPHTIVELHE
jgi:hypothetical protein